MYNKLVASPGQRINLGSEGGVLLLQPPAQIPGQMTLTDLQNRTWHLLREDGPDTGYPAPTSGDFNITVVTRDLNIALAQFVSDAGLSPDLTDRMDVFPVLPLLDHPVPPGLVGLHRIEYTPAGQQLYRLHGLSLNEFDSVFGDILPSDTGQPYYYREAYAGYIRLQPAPGLGQAVGPGIGTIALNGTPTVGDQTTITVSNGVTPFTSLPVVTSPSDTTSTLAFNLANALNLTGAVTGAGAYLAPSSPVSNQINLTAQQAPGTNITYKIATTSATMTATPTTATPLSPNGDTMTWYYSTLGLMLVNPGDVPNIPPQFCMALVYRVLMDYWRRKQDLNMAKEYERMYGVDVKRAMTFTYDSKRSTQPTIGGDDEEAEYPSAAVW